VHLRGPYVGVTSQTDTTGRHAPMSFNFDGQQVRLFSYQDELSCSDGTFSGFKGTPRTLSSSLPVDSHGSFAFDYVTPSGATHYTITGQITASGAHGTLRETEKLSTEHQPDPNGPITCDTGAQTWDAQVGGGAP
jgi:hypothetical protein